MRTLSLTAHATCEFGLLRCGVCSLQTSVHLPSFVAEKLASFLTSEQLFCCLCCLAFGSPKQLDLFGVSDS